MSHIAVKPDVGRVICMNSQPISKEWDCCTQQGAAARTRPREYQECTIDLRMVTAREELQEGLELITPVAALFISCYNLQSGA